MEIKTRDDVYAETTRMDIHDLVRELIEKVGPTIVQTMAGMKDRNMPSQWVGALWRTCDERQLRTLTRRRCLPPCVVPTESSPQDS